MQEIVVAVGCLAVLLFYLTAERILLERRRRCIPLRIAVTGTRGKSSLARLIASGLREAGYPTLAKTTGSRPILIHPDGEEKEIPRRGPPTVLEDKNLLRAGAALGARALVAEMMSIHPESSFVESDQILRPHFLAITNVRIDHVAQMGATREDVARCLATMITRPMVVLIPEEECFPVFEQAADAVGATLVKVPRDASAGIVSRKDTFELEENRHLALAVTDRLGIDRDVALAGMRKARPDSGALIVWKCDFDTRSMVTANLFAANDPDSTRRSLDWLLTIGDLAQRELNGLLSLRADRADRTIQWLDALAGRRFPELDRLFIIGVHGDLVASKLRATGDRPIHVLRKRTPACMMEEISGIVRDDALLVGMGNMVGIGERLVDHWARTGNQL